jgi:high-affinity Fe2+/Pb2+ permease
MQTRLPASAEASDGDASESADDRHNRQLVELLNELRVVLPGVQMLFGFLLAVPFTQRFSTVSNLQSNLYYGTFLAATAASVFLIAPASFHRIVWRHGRKRNLLHVSNKLAIIGTAFLAVAIAGSVGLVTSLLFGNAWAACAVAFVAGLIAVVWFMLPFVSRLLGAPPAERSRC